MGIYDYDTKEEITISPKYISEKGKIKNMMIMGFKDEIDEIKNIFSEIVRVWEPFYKIQYSQLARLASPIQTAACKMAVFSF